MADSEIDPQPEPVGMIQLLILASVAVRPDGAYAAGIVEALGAECGRSFVLAQIHVGLKRLESRGLVRDTTTVTGARPGKGKPRRYYAITPEGLAAIGAATPSVLALARLFSACETNAAAPDRSD